MLQPVAREVPIPKLRCSIVFRSVFCIAVAVMLVTGAASRSDALLNFAESRLVAGEHPYPEPYGCGNLTPSVAGDGDGRWIVVWIAQCSNSRQTVDVDLLMSTSVDGGRTWDAPRTLGDDVDDFNPAFWIRDEAPEIASDGNGRWLVVWVRDDHLVSSTSVDFGTTWSAPSIVDTLSSADQFRVSPWGMDLRADGSGGWIVLFQKGDGTYVARSADSQTWTAPQEIGGGSANPSVSLTVGAGALRIAGWVSDDKLYSSRSSDGGATWSSPFLHVTGTNSALGSSIGSPSVAIDSVGHVMLVWGHMTDEGRAHVAESFDGGATWSAERRLLDEPGLNWVIIRSGGSGRWFLISTHSAALQARSVDDGATWSETFAINRDTYFSGGFWLADLEPDDDGGWQLVWQQTGYDIRSAPTRIDCPATPEPTCSHTADPKRSALGMRHRASELTGDSLRWSWKSSAGGNVADFGSPQLSDRYVLCVYDSVGGSPRLSTELDLTNASECADAPCWTSSSDGFEFRDSFGLNGPPLNVKLRVTPTGKSAVTLQASGLWLTPPSPPLSVEPELAAQLHNLDNGSCWQAFYSEALKNDASQIRAKSD